MSVMDGLPETALHNAVQEHIETTSEILDQLQKPEEEPKEIVLTELDRLKAENLSLRIQTLMFTREKFIAQANQKVGEYDQQIMEIRASIGEFQKELDARYGIDFSKFAIEPGTGRVIPAPQS